MSGPENIRGFDYQISYTILRIIEILLNDRDKIETVKFESLDENEEDFNIYWKDGSIEYIQIKKRDECYHWTPTDIKKLIIKYNEKYDKKTTYRFVTNGSANIDVRDFKKKINKGKKPEDRILKKFKPDEVELNRLKNLVTSMRIDTLYYPSDIEEEPAIKLKQETLSILNGPNFYLTKDANEIYNFIWKFIFDKSKNASQLDIIEIYEVLCNSGARIVENKEWMRIPDIHSFSGRDYECEKVDNALLDTRKVVIKGISGIGKTFIAAKIAQKLDNCNRTVCWLNLNNQVDIGDIISLICNLLNHIGAKNESSQLKCSREQLQQAQLLCTIMENYNLFLFIDSYEKAIPSVRKFFEVVFRKYNTKLGQGGILVTTIERYDLYNNVDIRLKNTIEFNITEFCYLDFLSYFKDLINIIDENEIKRIYKAIGGFPISMVFIKQLFNAGEINKFDIDELLTFTIEERNKWIFEKIYSTFDKEYQQLISDLSVMDYYFSNDEVKILQDNIGTNSKYMLQVLADKSILIFDGKEFYMHDAVRELAYDTLVSFRKIMLHEIFMNDYETKMLKFNNKNRKISFKWGYHCEKLFHLSPLKVQGVNNNLFRISNQSLEDVWGTWISGYPFEFADESLEDTENRIKYLLSEKLIVNNVENTEFKYKLNEFSLKDMFILEYLVLSRGVSHYMGYIEKIKPNLSISKQPKTICIWEHCIEHFPLERGKLSCPIFGHNCPAGMEQALICKENLM